jgi:hypothetical protein
MAQRIKAVARRIDRLPNRIDARRHPRLLRLYGKGSTKKQDQYKQPSEQ